MPEVLFEDNHLIAVNKPAGIAVQGDITGDMHLLNLVAAYLKSKYNKPGDAFVGLIHRLDRPVSGVVVLAKTSKALTRMNQLFRNKHTTKTYHAVSEILLESPTGTLRNFLGKDTVKNRALTYNYHKPGTKEAILHYELIRTYSNYSLYEIALETGRFHQIRAQMSKAGAPLVGDVKYGAGKPLTDRSIALHARSLEFEHPVSHQMIKIIAKYPNTPVWQRFV